MWQFNNASWDQDDSSCRFALRALNGLPCKPGPVAPLDLLLGAKKHPSSSQPCAQGFFPAEFSFCPSCSSPLLETRVGEAGSWIPPYGAGNGLRVLAGEFKAGAAAASGEEFVLPAPMGNFAFAATRMGGKKRLLLALERELGQLWVYHPEHEHPWSQLEGRIGACALPNWSWSMACDAAESGCAVPTQDGPAWVSIDWASNQLVVDRGTGTSVGAPVRLKDLVLAPTLKADQFSVLLRRQGDSQWSDCAALSDPSCVAPQLRRRAEQLAVLGIPVVDEIRLVAYWPCRGGYVKVSYPEGAATASWSFRPWTSTARPATALLEIGVPYRKTGSRPGLWQLCEDFDPTSRDGILNKIIKFDGDEGVDSEVVECGQFLTTGRSSFSWLYDHWSDVHQRNLNIGEQLELRYPLLQFGDKGLVLLAKVRPWEDKEDMGLFTDILSSRSSSATTFVRFVIQGPGTPEKALQAKGVDGVDGTPGSLFCLPVAQLAEVNAFVYNDQLHLHFGADNSCFRWPLEGLGS